MDDLINVPAHEYLDEEKHPPKYTDFKNLYVASLETGLSEAELVVRCGRVWMDCSESQEDTSRDFTSNGSRQDVSQWLGRGSVCGKRAMPLWGELTRGSVRKLIGRLRKGNQNLRGLKVHEKNCLFEEEVKLLSINAFSVDVELLRTPESYLDQPALYIETAKLNILLRDPIGDQISATFLETFLTVCDHTTKDTMIRHIELPNRGNRSSQDSQSREEIHKLDCGKDSSTEGEIKTSKVNGSEADDVEGGKLTQPNLPKTLQHIQSTYTSCGVAEPIPQDALLKLKTPWPELKISAAFSEMVRQGWISQLSEDDVLEHFSNSTLRDPVPTQTTKLNWIASKSLLNAVMKNLEVKLAEVHKHFSHKDKEMRPLKSGLKDSEYEILKKADELLKPFRP